MFTMTSYDVYERFTMRCWGKKYMKRLQLVNIPLLQSFGFFFLIKIHCDGESVEHFIKNFSKCENLLKIEQILKKLSNYNPTRSIFRLNFSWHEFSNEFLTKTCQKVCQRSENPSVALNEFFFQRVFIQRVYFNF